MTGIFTLVAMVLLALPIFARDNDEREAKLAQSVKTTIQKLGIGPNAKVEVELKSGIKVKGYVTAINGESFSVMDAGSGNVVEIPYPAASKAKTHHKALAFAIFAAAVIVLVLAIKGAKGS